MVESRIDGFALVLHAVHAGNDYRIRLPLVGDFLSFNEIIATLGRQGNKFSFKRVPREVFAGWFPGAESIAAMLSYFEAHTYLGADSREAIALANKVAGQQPTKFAAWARTHFATPAAA